MSSLQQDCQIFPVGKVLSKAMSLQKSELTFFPVWQFVWRVALTPGGEPVLYAAG